MELETVKLSTDLGLVALVDENTGFAFGPTFKNEWEAEGFLEYLTEVGVEDPRELSQKQWQDHLYEYHIG